MLGDGDADGKPCAIQTKCGSKCDICCNQGQISLLSGLSVKYLADKPARFFGCMRNTHNTISKCLTNSAKKIYSVQLHHHRPLHHHHRRHHKHQHHQITVQYMVHARTSIVVIPLLVAGLKPDGGHEFDEVLQQTLR